MELKEGRLKVFYCNELNQELDKAIKKAVKPFGYELYGSGMASFPECECVRDLGFEKKD